MISHAVHNDNTSDIMAQLLSCAN